jgi:hypothetical protein
MYFGWRVKRQRRAVSELAGIANIHERQRLAWIHPAQKILIVIDPDRLLRAFMLSR